MTATQDKSLQISLAGSLAFHAILLMLLAWMLAVEAVRQWKTRPAAPRVEEKEVTLIFPDQILPKPPPALPKPEPKDYIRTTQNEAESAKPKKADFISDRNTTAKSELAADPDGTQPLPTSDGPTIQMQELVDRDYRDGELREDSAVQRPPLPGMLHPDAMTARATPRTPPPVPPAAPIPPTPLVAKAETPASPIDKMIEDMDGDLARVELNRLPLDVRKAEMQESPPEQQPSPESPAATPAGEIPPAPKAVPVAEPVKSPEMHATDDAFTPFTRTSKVKGTISNRGKASVNAEETPMGRYMRAVTSQVEKKWHIYRRQRMDAVTFGSLKLEFFVEPDGTADDLRIISDPRNADPRMADFTLQAIQDADIPPIPEDLIPILEGGRMRIEYDVLIY